MKSDLNRWVIEKLKQHNWSMRELARKMEIDHAQISRVLSDKQQAKLDFYVRIAEAFDAIPELLKAAGMIPAATEDDQVAFAELLEVVKRLRPEDRQDVLDYAGYRLWRDSCKIRSEESENKDK